MRIDRNKMRRAHARAVSADLAKQWQFRMEVEGSKDRGLPDLDLYITDLSYGPTEIATEEIELGSTILNLPVSNRPVTLSTTMRDTSYMDVSNWFDEEASKAVNSDGTVNVPYHPTEGFVRKVTLYKRVPGAGADVFEDKPHRTYEMIFLQRGDVTQSVRESGFLEFPCIFLQIRS